MGSDTEREKRKKSKKKDRDEEVTTRQPTSQKDGAFVWKKKEVEDGLDKLSEEQKQLLAKRKEQEKKVELWKVQRRREERELEQAARAEEIDRARQEKEGELFREWQEQEGQFHLEQARIRSEIRIKDNRANPIDLIAYYIYNADNTAVEIMGEPLSVVDNLGLDDLEDLQADIHVYMDLDKNQTEHVFWTDLEVVCKEQIRLANARIKLDRNPRSSINSAVNSDVSKIFRGKTSGQLTEMHKGIQEKLKKRGPIDVSYWENVAAQAHVAISRTRLQERHQQITKHKDFAARSKAALEGKEGQELFPSTSSTKKKKKKEKEGMSAGSGIVIVKRDDPVDQCEQEYEDMCYTPIRHDTIDMDALVYTESKIQKEIQEMRAQVAVMKRSSTEKTDQERDVNVEERGLALMGDATEDEELFNCDIQLNTTYSWADKYKPRKPRFYNRVHTGYEWNKYNQTHYDQDNPPPKIVQGYKFNIFYQDLIDPTCTPTYKLKKCPDDKDFKILTISAGPPYEDIAFKVLNREWEYSNRYSFKSQYTQGIFQLWFQFKRYRYRR